jgi:hypothetical protein
MRASKNIVIEDRRLLGNANWHVVRNVQGKVVVRREADIKGSDTVLGGPYETKDQASCEKSDFTSAVMEEKQHVAW